jgi:capsular polysaccharide export protein
MPGWRVRADGSPHVNGWRLERSEPGPREGVRQAVQPVGVGASGLTGAPRRFLFLQGVASPFFPRLADSLRAEGHEVFRVNFCAGDAWLWGRRPAWSCRGEVAGVADLLERRLQEHGITDILLFGNQRPVHRPAIALARRLGIRVHVFEEGYVRPNWLTLERGGVNGESGLPRDPAWYLRANAGLPSYGDGLPVRGSLAVRAAHDMAYHAANLANPLLFPGYRTHRPYRAGVEYAGWVRRFSAFPWRKRADARLLAGVAEGRKPFFLFPLQLNGDSQITCHSPYRDMGEVLTELLHSFAVHAPKESCLVVKNHPLDTGLFDYPRLIRNLALELDLQDRVLFVETGDLAALFERTLGVVTVNSTVGMSALRQGCPTMALGTAIYDLPGLTFQGRLDEFWRQAARPDAELFRAFRNVVIHATQVNGDFYTDAGIAMAVAGCRRMLAERSPLEELLS